MNDEKARIRMELAGRIRQLRGASRISISELSSRLGISRPTYYQTEAGTRDVPADELVQMARVFNVSVTWLLGLEPDDRQTG